MKYAKLISSVYINCKWIQIELKIHVYEKVAFVRIGVIAGCKGILNTLL